MVASTRLMISRVAVGSAASTVDPHRHSSSLPQHAPSCWLFRHNTPTSVPVPAVCQGHKYSNLTEVTGSRRCINTDTIRAWGMLSTPRFPSRRKNPA
ncbi:hypothetical protein EYF80_009465 [Liparis tanakae]|uniref:Uncharacterized protein n=1 Tax=Liparis tanakae TaxID=230148 RepID=A0A4Z2IRH9_9TELE|nr:hypothetical protein EYF80_009465 [Liparis tanakae]